jgi:hypothetical protein
MNGSEYHRKLARRPPEGRQNVAGTSPGSKDWLETTPKTGQKACKSARLPDWPEMSPKAGQNW